MNVNPTSPAAVDECDVLIIGGGPAGSTAATLLARRNYRVPLVEKARHPRFHIGGSLLPANLPLLEKLGVAGEVRAIGMEKRGAEIMSPRHAHKQAFHFGDALDKSMPYAYQVERAGFDEILIRIGPHLPACKAICYGISLFNPGRTCDAWKMRRRNIRPADAAP